MKKKIMLYLFDDEYDFVSAHCENEKISMNRYFQDWVRDQMKDFEGFSKLKTNTKDNFKISNELKPIKTVSEVKKVVTEKFTGLCQHGAMKGLCKKGCV